jgi:hypothetical protein
MIVLIAGPIEAEQNYGDSALNYGSRPATLAVSAPPVSAS